MLDDPQQFELHLRLARTPAEELSDADLLMLLAQRYATEPVPPCWVCGGPLSMVAAGGGNATRYACSGQEDDPDNPQRIRYKPGRALADEHYSRSAWTHYQAGDGHVRELIERYQRNTST